jgi:hypothetical protein
LEEEVLTFGVADDTLTVTAELRVMRRQEHEARERPLAEPLDDVAVAKL